eukprot:7472458-Pyramimonas_sp.AAC.1
MLSKPQLRLPQPKQGRMGATWLAAKEEPSQAKTPTAKGSRAEGPTKMEGAKTKEQHVIDLLGDMKNQATAPTTGAQKVEEGPGRQAPLGRPARAAGGPRQLPGERDA